MKTKKENFYFFNNSNNNKTNYVKNSFKVNFVLSHK